ncbi:hypothetical protein Hypma_009470 [Hypsizygus marmoreus]|uniref:Uncharacterized protein n=1 Tax=Hypsizygus marmoreus TaxID=39966 RepID=A0A369JMA5_HYPMA|nr:hypothetical protein Hypma_009470 [Hypsizygus marmoreus]
MLLIFLIRRVVDMFARTRYRAYVRCDSDLEIPQAENILSQHLKCLVSLDPEGLVLTVVVFQLERTPASQNVVAAFRDAHATQGRSQTRNPWSCT